MGGISGVNSSMNSHLPFQHNWYFNNGHVSCGNGFINSHTLSQCNDSIALKYTDGYVENGDRSGVHGSMNTHNIYKQNGLNH